MCRNVSASPSVSASPAAHLITHEPLCRVLCIYVCSCPLWVCLIFSALLLSFPPSFCFFSFFFRMEGPSIREKEGRARARRGGRRGGYWRSARGREAGTLPKERERKREKERASTRASQNERRREFKRPSTDRERQGVKEIQRLRERERAREQYDRWEEKMRALLNTSVPVTTISD